MLRLYLVTYAADWSEYFGHQPDDGSGDVYFHLDPLWANEEIDFIGIDNYMPLSDWRDGETHADVGWGAIHNVDLLRWTMGEVRPCMSLSARTIDAPKCCAMLW